MESKINNRNYLKEKRRRLRNNMTTAEVKLWKYIKNGALDGRKFRRQHSVGNYILDFYCPSEKLCIEVDGKGHLNRDTRIKDKVRTEYLNNHKIKVCRFENRRVFENIDSVLFEIKSYFKTPPPSPPCQGGEHKGNNAR